MRNVTLAQVSEPDRKAAMPSDATSTTPISPAIEARVLSIGVPFCDIVPSIIIVSGSCCIKETGMGSDEPVGGAGVSDDRVLKWRVEFRHAESLRTDMIDQFDGGYAFLSNFWPGPVVLDRVTYPTVEHAFQAAKTRNRHERESIAALPTPGAAKRAGRKVTLREDWERVKVGIMEELVRQKFADPELAGRLLATGDEELVEGNTWNDRFWGVCRGQGLNELGKILMRVRAELREQSSR
jgi:hypothetical protein